MKSAQPLVSIVIPVFNGGSYLREAIDSALAQDYPNTEVLVIDDGSNDGGHTASVAASYGDRIRYAHKPNGGVSTALNVAVRDMRGEYFSWLSHDDLYLPNKLSLQLQALRHTGAARTVVYSDYYFCDPKGRIYFQSRLPSCSTAQFKVRLLEKSFLHGCSCLVPAQAFRECGAFAEDLRYTQDFNLWLRMAKAFDFVLLPRPLVIGRQHPQQTGRTASSAFVTERNRLFLQNVDAISASDLRADGFSSESVFFAYCALHAKRQRLDPAYAGCLERLRRLTASRRERLLASIGARARFHRHVSSEGVRKQVNRAVNALRFSRRPVTLGSLSERAWHRPE